MRRNAQPLFLSAMLLIFCPFLLLGQTREITITFIGNCGLYLTDGKANLYVDFPYQSGAFNYMKYEKSQLDSIKPDPYFLFTHRHPDHYAGKLVNRFHGKIYGPWNVPKKKRFEPEKPGSPFSDFSLQAFKTKHRFSSRHNSYLITWHGKKIFISGDTESAEPLSQVSGIDWAFVPYWVLYDAKEKNLKIDAKMKAVYHMYPNQKTNGEVPQDLRVLKTQNEVITIPY